MAPSVPLQAFFRKWSGLNSVESCLIVSSAVLKVLISAHTLRLTLGNVCVDEYKSEMWPRPQQDLLSE